MADFKKEYKAAMDSITPDKELLEKIKEDMKAELEAPQKKPSFFVMHKTALSAAALVLTLGITVFAAVMITGGVQNITSDSGSRADYNGVGAAGMNKAEGMVITIPEYDDNIYEPNGNAADEGAYDKAWEDNGISSTSVTTRDQFSADIDIAENAEMPADFISNPTLDDADAPAAEAAMIPNEELFPESATVREENEETFLTVTYSLLKDIAENADKYSLDFYTSLNSAEEINGYYTVSFVYYGENGDYMITACAESANDDALPIAIVMARYADEAVDTSDGIDLLNNSYRLDDYLNGDFSEEIEQIWTKLYNSKGVLLN